MITLSLVSHISPSIKKVQSHPVPTKFPSLSAIESLSVPYITSSSLEGTAGDGTVKKQGRMRRKKEEEEPEGKTHLDKELQLPVIQEMDLTAPPFCHLAKRQKDKEGTCYDGFLSNCETCKKQWGGKAISGQLQQNSNKIKTNKQTNKKTFLSVQSKICVKNKSHFIIRPNVKYVTSTD